MRGGNWHWKALQDGKGPLQSIEEKVESCTGSLKRCPIDCKLSKWSKVTCRVACGVSEVKYSDRFVLVSPQYGGKKCGVQKRPVVCEGDLCPDTTGEIVAGVAGGAGGAAAILLALLLFG